MADLGEEEGVPEAPARVEYAPEELYDHGDAKRRLRQLKAEQEMRRKRMEEVRRKEEEALREQMRVDELKLQERMHERELEQQRQKEERMAKYRQEREARKQERTAWKKQQAKASHQVPLYKRREEEYKKRLDDEEAARKEELRKKRQAYEPIDFVRLSAEAVEREQGLREAREARRAARLEAEREATASLPPLPNYYAGKVHERIVAEQFEAKRKVEIQREKARKMHMKAQRYAKLVAELDPAKGVSKAGHSKATDGGGGSSHRPPRKREGPTSELISSASDFVPSAATNELQAKLSQLDAKIGSKEQAQGKMSKGSFKSDPTKTEEMLQLRTDLSALYIDAIKYKVELLHAIRTQRSSSAPHVTAGDS